MKINCILQGNAKDTLKTIPNESIDMCITSPPYWALRDYGAKGQLGLEPNFSAYIENLCDVFDEVKRTLKKEGTCWVNLGDTYAGSQSTNSSVKCANQFNAHVKECYRKKAINSKVEGVQNKCLTLIPFRFALEMVNRGWILRNVIIWHKPNCMPSSVKDRFTVDFEYLFFFSKSKKYFFKQQREPHKDESIIRTSYGWNGHREPMSSYCGMNIEKMCHPDGRNKRCVWTVPTKGLRDAHFAVFPNKLIETPISAGCSEKGIVLDPFLGSGTTALVALKQNKRFLGIELNKSYIKIAKRRILSLLENGKSNI
ncbi:MAG: site-specific DNA-methyltransferase [Nanoarchaeota archaeon]|nr:site-specific DNA-methyltransferase [Nanoarchaeota archaeon]